MRSKLVSSRIMGGMNFQQIIQFKHKNTNFQWVKQTGNDVRFAMVKESGKIVTRYFGKIQQFREKVSSKLRETFPARYVRFGMFPTWKRTT